MRKGRRGYPDTHDLSELDKLVINELNALKKGQKESPYSEEDEQWQDNEHYERPTEEGQSLKRRKSRPLKKNLREKESFDDKSERDSYEDVQFEDERFEDERFEKKRTKRKPVHDRVPREQWEPTGPEFGVDLTHKGEDILDEEEEKFVAHVIKWLKPKNNKDIIISRIWSALTEEEPESFYSPESDKIDVQKTKKSSPPLSEPDSSTKKAEKESQNAEKESQNKKDSEK